MAPDVSQLNYYFAKSLFDADIFEDFDYWANDPNGPREMNASFGECEENPTNPVTGPLAQQPYGTEFGDELEAVGNPILRQAAIEGRTLFSSAGDNGSGCPQLVAPVAGAGNGVAPQPVPMVNFPCDSEYAVCVGGTVVSVNGSSYPQSAQRAAETTWTDSGGGSSYFLTAPGFQTAVANVNHPCLSTPTGDPYPPASAPTCRGVPDVADMSGNVTGDAYFIYIDGEPSSEGGTSLSSPLMVGQWARVQAAASSAVQKRGGLGFADETIYRQAASADSCTSSDTTPCTSGSYARDFFDVAAVGVRRGQRRLPARSRLGLHERVGSAERRQLHPGRRWHDERHRWLHRHGEAGGGREYGVFDQPDGQRDRSGRREPRQRAFARPDGCNAVRRRLRTGSRRRSRARASARCRRPMRPTVRASS